MSVLTPTASSSLIAGFVLWLVGWMVFLKLDQIPFVGRFVNKDRMIRWILDHKLLSILITELINIYSHGIGNPAVVMFVVGGTLFNVSTICAFLPLTYGRKFKKSARQILQGEL